MYARFLKNLKLYNCYSQFGEDAILEAIFSRIGTANKWCCECGAADGLFFSNTRKLIEDGWNSVQIEADSENFEALRKRYARWNRGKVLTLNYKVAPEGWMSFDRIFASLLKFSDTGISFPVDLDLLVIDVDGQDYHLWNNLFEYRPRVVVCEFDPNIAPDFIPEIGGAGQAGERAIHHVALARGYQPVCKTQTNLICVRNDLAHLLADDPESFNLERERVKVSAATSTPRLGFMAHTDCVFQAVLPLGIPLYRNEGAYWAQGLTRGIEACLRNKPDYVLTLDYDTLFTKKDIEHLAQLLENCPEYDVLVPLQQKREGGEMLANSDGEVNINQAVVPIADGHFGLTLFRASAFDKLALPWFQEKPGPDGRWSDGRTDADISFWQNCRKSGVKVGLAMDVVVGHLELMATWPDVNLKPHHQYLEAWRNGAMRPPAEAFTRAALVARAERCDVCCNWDERDQKHCTACGGTRKRRHTEVCEGIVT